MSLNHALWTKYRIFTLNPIFVKGAFIALGVTTMLHVGPMTLAVFVSELWPIECRSACGALSVVNSPGVLCTRAGAF